jgi:hypothetical protein
MTTSSPIKCLAIASLAKPTSLRMQLRPPLEAAAVVNIVPRSIPMQLASMQQNPVKMALNTFAHFFIRSSGSPRLGKIFRHNGLYRIVGSNCFTRESATFSRFTQLKSLRFEVTAFAVRAPLNNPADARTRKLVVQANRESEAG